MEATIIIEGIEYTLIPKEEKKDWKILSLKNSKGTLIEKFADPLTPLNFLNNESSWFINSVKRLSNGEVFAIGDKIDDDLNNSFHVIDAFILDYKGNSLWISHDKKEGYGCALYVAKHYKVPLFVTHDNISYYKTEPMKEWWSVDNRTFYVGKTNGFCDKDYIIRFSTKEAAEKYIEENKPKPVILTTVDNQPITDPEQNLYWVIPANNFKLLNIYAKWANANETTKDDLFFFNKDNAKQFVELQRSVPVSQKEIIETIEQALNFDDALARLHEYFSLKINL